MSFSFALRIVILFNLPLDYFENLLKYSEYSYTLG